MCESFTNPTYNYKLWKPCGNNWCCRYYNKMKKKIKAAVRKTKFQFKNASRRSSSRSWYWYNIQGKTNDMKSNWQEIFYQSATFEILLSLIEMNSKEMGKTECKTIIPKKNPTNYKAICTMSTLFNSLKQNTLKLHWYMFSSLLDLQIRYFQLNILLFSEQKYKRKTTRNISTRQILS